MEVLKLDRRNEVISTKQFMNNPELEKLFNKVKKEKNIELGPAQVELLLVYPHISKQRPAKAIKCNPEMVHMTGFHFILEFSGELWDMLDSKTKEMAMFNQLLHLKAKFKSKTQEWKFSIRKPDYADYYEISDRHGNEWYKTIQATASSLYDLDPDQENQVSLF
jgi:hypothetical protein